MFLRFCGKNIYGSFVGHFSRKWIRNFSCICENKCFCNYELRLCGVRSLNLAKCKTNTFCTRPLDPSVFEDVCSETLESLSEYFEELVEDSSHLTAADVSFSDGVLTVNFGEPYGTYVINRQTPNQQIWLSSPSSGPKRYNWENGQWVYHHDGVPIHDLLTREVSEIVKRQVDFKRCAFSQNVSNGH